MLSIKKNISMLIRLIKNITIVIIFFNGKTQFIDYYIYEFVFIENRF